MRQRSKYQNELLIAKKEAESVLIAKRDAIEELQKLSKRLNRQRRRIS